MMALFIFYQSREAYRLLSKLFVFPSKRTLQRSLQSTNILPDFNDVEFDALKVKVNNMDEKDKCVASIFDEMSVKSALVYKHDLDKIEDFKDLSDFGNSNFVADHALVFIVRGLLSK